MHRGTIQREKQKHAEVSTQSNLSSALGIVAQMRKWGGYVGVL